MNPETKYIIKVYINTISHSNNPCRTSVCLFAVTETWSLMCHICLRAPSESTVQTLRIHCLPPCSNYFFSAARPWWRLFRRTANKENINNKWSPSATPHSLCKLTVNVLNVVWYFLLCPSTLAIMNSVSFHSSLGGADVNTFQQRWGQEGIWNKSQRPWWWVMTWEKCWMLCCNFWIVSLLNFICLSVLFPFTKRSGGKTFCLELWCL